MYWPLSMVYLNVAHLRQSVAFYQQTIGLQTLQENGSSVTMGVTGTPLLHLTEQPKGEHSQGGTGLYHFAILLPSRLELAKVLKHFAEARTPLQGLSDHFVSEA
ncbi:MAG: VOC family protein, partial [Chitinophagaceae bacterium]|nr:VOC family protein [Anaerolineae bacterium]